MLESGGWFEGDAVAQGFELADVLTLPGRGRPARVVEVRAEVGEPGLRVGQQVPGDDQQGVADRDQGALFAAAAKGVDRLLKVGADYDAGSNTHALAHLFLPFVQEFQPDLVLTGVQAANSLDGSLGTLLAASLGWPYVGYVSCVTPQGNKVEVRKEFPGGLTAQMEVQLPAVLGVQAAETPPRYVPIAKVRLAMKTSKIEEVEGEPLTLDLVKKGIGYTVTPFCAVQAEIKSGQLSGAPIRGLTITWALGVSRVRAHAPAVRELIALIQQAVDDRVASGTWHNVRPNRQSATVRVSPRRTSRTT